MLVHICCSVDSHYFLQRIQKDYPNEIIKAFFYDPNIHPYSEYQLRLLDVKYSCQKLGIELIEGEYDYIVWLNAVKGLEKEPEKGNRCLVCFDKRLEEAVKKAKKLNEKYFTTTLLMSPLKSQDRLNIIAQELALKYKLEFVFKDYRIKDGITLQNKEVKENNLYRQNYCGCIYALNKQRDEQNKFCDELISNIGQQILPDSIEEKLELYKSRNYFNKNNIRYKIIKNTFLNYRLLNAKVTIDKKIIFSYFIIYSTLLNKKTKGYIEYSVNDICYLNKNAIKFMTLETFNLLTSSNYKNIQELIYSPLTYKEEIEVRNKIIKTNYDLSCLIVLDKIDKNTKKIEIYCDSQIYEDTKENIIEDIS